MSSPPNTIFRSHVWSGTIPIQLSVASEDLKLLGDNALELVYVGKSSPRGTMSNVISQVSAPRISYFALLTAKIKRYFTDLAMDPSTIDDSSIWYDFEGVPLKWQYPIGLLFDLNSGYRPDDATRDLLPWQITIHFSKYPAEKLFKSYVVEGTQDAFMSSVKEADYLRTGSAKRIISLSKNDQTALWDGLAKDDFDKYWSVANKIVQTDTSLPKNIPLRIYLPDSAPVVQEPLPPLDVATTQPHTLGSALHALLPELFPSTTRTLLAYPVLHGIIPPLDSPILWLSQNLAYPDGCLHIVINVQSHEQQ